MAPFLNLAALTGEELERLLGAGAAQKLRPEISQARLEGKPYRGPELPGELHFSLLDGGAWGATAGHARRLQALRQASLAQGFQELGALYLSGALGARHHLALIGGGDTAAALRWSETVDEWTEPPYTQLLTLLRDRASGFAAVLTSTALLAPVPALSEEVALRHLPGAEVDEASAAHRAEVLRHGRGVKLASLDDWQRAWQALRKLNTGAWTRRGVLLDPAKGER